MDTLPPVLQKIIRKRSNHKIRCEAWELQREIDAQKAKLNECLEHVNVTISCDNDELHLHKTYCNCCLPIQHRQLIDMLLTGWSNNDFIEALMKQLREHQKNKTDPRKK